jgi:glycosyltransferase involved in cell wall biosynthesis
VPRRTGGARPAQETGTPGTGVSEYNRKELQDVGFEPTAVLPLLYDPERLTASAHPVILEMYDDEMTNFLFVGRVTPNKRFEDLIKIVKIYQRSIDRKCRLLCVGQWRDVERYYERLIGLADVLDLRRVEFPGHVSTGELVAFYRVADVFLSMSEHEGFCAPLLESFQMGVPVIAYDAGAVSETLGGAGILVHEKKFDEIAELAGLLVTDEGLRERVVGAQDRVLDEVLARNDDERLLRFVDEVGAS